MISVKIDLGPFIVKIMALTNRKTHYSYFHIELNSSGFNHFLPKLLQSVESHQNAGKA